MATFSSSKTKLLTTALFTGIVGLGLSLNGQMAMNSTGPAKPLDMSTLEVQAILKRKMRSMPDMTEDKQIQIARKLTELCDRHSFNVGFILSVIQSESRFHPEVISNKGAVGLMQIQLPTANFIARRAGIHRVLQEIDLKNPILNVTLGVQYLAHLRNMYSNSAHFLSAYNMGPARLEQLKLRERGLGQFSKVREYVVAIHAGEYLLRLEGRRLASL